jgi:hypothetical protein
MNCAEVTSLASEYLDRRLDKNQAADLEEHLRGCPGCRREMSELKATISLVSALEPVEAPPDFVVQINRRIDAAERKGILKWLFSPPKIKVPLEIAALLLVSTLAVHFYRQTSEMSPVTALRKPTEIEGQREVETPKEKLREKKIASDYPVKSEAKPEPMAEKAAPQPSPSAHKQEQGETASFEKRLDPQIVGQPRALPAPVMQRAETETSRDVARPAPPLPGPPIHEVRAKDPVDYENRVKGILERFDGKLLTRKEEPGSISLTIELPQSRQAEFLAAVREEPSQPERRRERSLSAPAGRPAGGAPAESLSKESGSKAILSLRILTQK